MEGEGESTEQTHWSHLTLLRSCFGANRSVGRRAGKLRACMQQVQRASRRCGLSWAVRKPQRCCSSRRRRHCSPTACRQRACVRAFLTALPMLPYVNGGERKRAGVRMTELLSYHPDDPLPGHMVSRKWRLRPAVVWFGRSYGGTSDSHRGKRRSITLKGSKKKNLEINQAIFC